MSKTNTVFRGRIIKVEQTSFPDGRTTEKASRPPGTRIIIHNPHTNQILLTREIRLDIGEDVRLPGGKVCDTQDQWDQVKVDPQLDSVIIAAAANEVRQEVGLEAHDLRIFKSSTSGGPTIDWTLYYLVATDFTDLGHQDLEIGEQISLLWTPIPEVINICLSGKMQEGRSVAALLQYLHSIKKI